MYSRYLSMILCLDKYRDIIKDLMNNDRNSCYDEIFKDNNYCLRLSIYELYDCLRNRIIEDSKYMDKEENDFYMYCLYECIDIGKYLKVFK